MSNEPEKTVAVTPADTTPSRQPDFVAGQIVAGRYRIIGKIAEGGMGIVYKVEQIFIKKELALKTITLRSDMSWRRFKHEAQAAFAVNHPNLISVHDFGVLEESDTPFLVMELLEGETLAERLKRTTRLSVAEAAQIFAQVCLGLAHAHSQGVVHRDIKPSNINLTAGPDDQLTVKVLDFGIAKLATREGGEIQALTQTGEIFGSPFYMSPEQCSGSKIDHRADVYSLGCTIFEALTGTPPFVGQTALATMALHQSGRVLPMKEASLGETFPVSLEEIVMKMLAKKPEERYQNLGKAAHDLANVGRIEEKAMSDISVAKEKDFPVRPPAKKEHLLTLRARSAIRHSRHFLLCRILFATSD